MSKLRKIFTIVVVFVGLGIIFTISELIYTYNNRPQLFGIFFLWNAKRVVENDPQRSLDFVAKGAKININWLSKKYKDLIPKDYETRVTLPSDSELFINEYVKYVQSLDIQKISSTEQIELSKIYYDLALLSFSQNEDKTGKLFLQNAVYLSPDLGHYHVELANYYLLKAEKENANKEIDFCLKFPSPTDQCEEYKKDYFENDIKNDPGFLKEDLTRYYLKPNSNN